MNQSSSSCIKPALLRTALHYGSLLDKPVMLDEPDTPDMLDERHVLNMPDKQDMLDIPVMLAMLDMNTGRYNIDY